MRMSKSGIQKNNFTYSKYHTGKSGAHKSHMTIIKCACGFEILIVPDLKAMSRAIENHVAKHSKSSSERLTDFLTEQVLIATCNKSCLNV
jgi:hypothetical protein